MQFTSIHFDGQLFQHLTSMESRVHLLHALFKTVFDGFRALGVERNHSSWQLVLILPLDWITTFEGTPPELVFQSREPEDSEKLRKEISTTYHPVDFSHEYDVFSQDPLTPPTSCYWFLQEVYLGTIDDPVTATKKALWLDFSPQNSRL